MRPNMEALIDIKELSRQSGMSVRSIRTLLQKGIVPHIRLGYRTIKFSPSRVERAFLKTDDVTCSLDFGTNVTFASNQSAFKKSRPESQTARDVRLIA
jgi:hypothetical protein